MSLADALRSRLPDLLVSDGYADRLQYARDLEPLARIGMQSARPGTPPALITWPRDAAETADLVAWANETRTPLVPYGAGSGVCGGAAPGAGAVVVDVKRMNRILSLDEKSLLVRVQPGVIGADLERWLNRRGYTLGHFPGSLSCSSVGGWLAARSGGQLSTKYGKIEDMVVSQELVLPTGEIVRTPVTPRAATGPDWDQLFVGSEGTLGVITEATLAVRLAPEARHFRAFRFEGVPAALEALRRIMQAGLRPAVTRVYDEIDAFVAGSRPRAGAAAGGLRRLFDEHPGLLEATQRTFLRRPGVVQALVDALPGSSLLILMFEGGAELTAVEADEAWAIAREAGGRDLGAGPGEAWMETRYQMAYRQSPLFAAGAFVDTCEVATTWSGIADLYFGMLRAVRPHALAMAHFSHAYADGVSVSFTFAGAAGEPEAQEQLYHAAWTTLMEACLKYGGTISHHHGVGRAKQRWLARELGGGMAVLRAAKRALDPAGIMNPGKLGFDLAEDA